MNKRNRRYKAKESKVKSSSKPKVIRINLSLLIGIIVFVLILVSSLTGHKISTMGTKVFANLVEEVTDGDDTWEIVNMSESEEDTEETENTNSENSEKSDNTENTTEESSNEEQIASVSESSDDEASAVSNEDVTYSSDEGVSAVASTVSVSTTGLSNIGGATINLPNVDWTDPSSHSSSSNLIYTTSGMYPVFYWNTSSLSYGNSLSGSITLTYENVGYDSAGYAIDITMSISLSVTNNSTTSKRTVTWDNTNSNRYLALILGGEYEEGVWSSNVFRNITTWDYTYPDYRTWLAATQTWSVTMTRHGTTTAATGNYMFYVSDIDIVTSTQDWPESVTLGSAFTNTVYLDPETTVKYSGNYFYATEADDNTDVSSLATLVGSSFSFTWKGTHCGTGFFMAYSSATITSKIYTSSNGDSGTYSLSTTGGKIYAKNYTSSTSSPTSGYTVLSQTSSTSASITVYYKNYYYYYTSANTGYHLVKIIYDGTTSTSASTYKFTSVASDHTFYAYYAANSYTVKFDGNGATSGSTSNMTDLYYDTTYNLNANGFVRGGYTFTGWNTKADGSGTSYTDQQSFSNLTTTDGGTITLYAQWEENKVTISITKVAQGDEDETLKGVEFSLFELICDNAAHDHDTDEDLIDVTDYDTDCWELIGTYTSGSDGTITLSDLPITRIYRLVETKTAKNYLVPSGQWKIEFGYDDNLTGTTYTVNGVELQVTGINNPPALSLSSGTLYLYNNESYDIPTTGLLGFDDFWKIGVPIILMGMIIYPIRKRKKVSKSKFGSRRESVNNARYIINNWDKRK